MRIKKGVVLDKISTKITKVFHKIEPILAEHNQELYVTSGLDGEHMEASLHYKGLAVDLRIWNLRRAGECVHKMRKCLGEDYDVVLEKDHIHLEFDPKTGDE